MKKSPEGVPLAEPYRAALTHEQYHPAPRIDGVWLHALRKHRSDNGAFLEYLRLDESGVQGLPGPLTPRQISVSWAAPARINAFHIHVLREQNEVWCVLQGQLKVWLVDCREGSPTLGVRRQLILSSEEPVLLYIPSGVAHGYRAGDQGATLLYAMDAQFDRDEPNEGRLPWDTFGEELWEEDRG